MTLRPFPFAVTASRDRIGGGRPDIVRRAEEPGNHVHGPVLPAREAASPDRLSGQAPHPGRHDGGVRRPSSPLSAA